MLEDCIIYLVGFVEMEFNMRYNKKDMEILTDIWANSSVGTMKCPKCGSKLMLVLVEPIEDLNSTYTPYDTAIECITCSFNIRAESFSILGNGKRREF